jgi:hypothetical protein
MAWHLELSPWSTDFRVRDIVKMGFPKDDLAYTEVAIEVGNTMGDTTQVRRRTFHLVHLKPLAGCGQTCAAGSP